MSTKKLSRTVIEGGRAGSNKWERRHSHAEVRAEERDYLKQVISNLDLVDEIEIGANRPVMKEFTDKLSPMYRWLDAQVGRPWSEVRSEVFTKFDTRTTAGRHITFDHLLREVVETDSGFDRHGIIADPAIPKESCNKRRYWYYSAAYYYVDQAGIFRVREEQSRTPYEFVPDQEFKDTEAWLAGRMIGERGGKLYWLVPTERVWKASWFEPYKNYDRYTPHNLKYFVLENGSFDAGFTGKSHGDYWQVVENPFSFRRRGELTSEELKTFKALKEKIRDDILGFSEGR